MYQLIHLCSKSSLVAAQCEFTTDADNRHGFCTLDQFCCKGFSVNNLCSTGGVCCYGSYDCSSGSNPSVHQTYSPCPEIITRQRWRARDASNVVPSIGPAEHVFIHHTDDGNTCFSEDTCGVRIRSLQSYHQLNKGWTDIAWNFLIGCKKGK
ncbi:unnamed protein product [Medioppia subpectinata]|uniref:Uncharacterized protein n=1 Tax=Medioppia subpectinata TaxID=1979941 RepID=A0A7R9KRB4_9ACAR|nr:unnamed protein product [Medioppia subpectinata]CAG2108349.1 unnamed protein product [Medioppia subpectinata]